MPNKLAIRNKEIRRVKVCDILDNELNHRTHGEDQIATFGEVVDKIGFFGYPDVFVTESGGLKLIDGELRKHHLQDAYGADAYIDVNVTDFTEEEAQTALATKDAVAAMSLANQKRLKELMDEQPENDGHMAELFDQLARQYKLKFDAGVLDMEDEGEGGLDYEWEAAEDDHVRMIQLYLTEATAIEFDTLCTKLEPYYDTDNSSDTIAKVLQAQSDRLQDAQKETVPA